MLDLLGAVPDPFDRRCFSPGHFTASGFVLSPDRRAVLLVSHRRLGRWLQPGGHIDPGDRDPESAARREITEETGVGALGLLVPDIFDVDIHAIPPRGDEPAHRHFDLRFAYLAAAGDIVVDPEVHDARWAPLDALDGYDLDSATRTAIDRLVALAGPAAPGRSRLHGEGERE